VTEGTTTPPDLWVVIGGIIQPRRAYDTRADAEEYIAVEKECHPDSTWHVERYQQAALVQRNNLPLAQRWFDAETVAVMLDVKPRQLRERIVRLPGFPKPAKVGTLRWNAAELDAWMRRQQANT
jgi:hypothetical protein